MTKYLINRILRSLCSIVIVVAVVMLMIYSALGRPSVSEPCDFTDVAPDAYYYDALAWAQSIGLVGGMGDGTFRPDAPITREQAFSVLRRVLSLLDLNCPEANATVLARFNDVGAISDYARSSTATLVAQGIVGGNGQGSINPRGNLTRAEMAAIVHRTMTHTPMEYPEDSTQPGDGIFTLGCSELIIWNSESTVLTVSGAEDGTVTWSSSDPTVATVSPEGVITNLNAGSTTQSVIITATYGSLTASCTVYCPQAQIVGIVRTNGGSLNIRSGPDTSYASQGALANGRTVVILSAENDWYSILYTDDAGQSRIGYVSASYMEKQQRW